MMMATRRRDGAFAIAQLAARRAQRGAFGYEPDDARALLANAMRALHAEVPLAEVVLAVA
jgi:hypothetical protein